MMQTPTSWNWLRTLSLIATLFTLVPNSFAQLAPDLTRLQGHWEGDGANGKCSITIEGNRLNFHEREDFWYETTFTLRTETDPPQLLATIVKDHDNASVGSMVLVIYKIEGDTLTLVVSQDAEVPPPMGFDSDPSAVLGRYELTRVKHPREKEKI